MTPMAGVSASAALPLPTKRYSLLSSCPTSCEQPTQAYRPRSKTLEKTICSAANFPCSCSFTSRRHNVNLSSGRNRYFSRPSVRGGRQLQVVHCSNSRHSRREWEKRNVAQQESLRVVTERAMRTQQQETKCSLHLQTAIGRNCSVSKGNWRHGLQKDLRKRLRSEGPEESEKRSTKRPRRDMKLQRATNGFSLYEWLKECDRNWERRVLGDKSKLEGQWEEADGEEEVKNRLPSTFTNVTEKKGPRYPQTNEPLVHLKNKANGAEVFIVGTSHISRRSVDQVREVIERVKPDFVLVELCRQRYDSLELRKSGKKASFIDQVTEKLTKGSPSALAKLLGAALAGISRIQSYHSSYPGQEFQVAMEEGMRVGAKVVLGDQDIETTLKLLGDFDLNMSMQDAFRLFGQPMPRDMAQALGTGQDVSRAEMFERFRDRRVVRRFNEEMEKGAPLVHKVLVDDRNEIMAQALRSLEGKVVAVVGLAHVDGLEQLWHEYNERC